MIQAAMCSVCRRPLPTDAPLGLCPLCLFQGAMARESTVSDADALSIRKPVFPIAGRVDPRHYEDTDVDSQAETLDKTGEAPTSTDDDRGTRDFLIPLRARLHDRPVIPGYETRGLLGRGGMGVVYKALQCRANRYVALKMIRGDAHLQPVPLERFRVEAEALARLRHPNVVQIHDVGEVDGRPFFSLELLEGGSLKDRLALMPMAPRPAAELLMVLARAIAAAHRVGIVHRDLKPSNVLYDDQDTPKIVDFGLAKCLGSEDGQTLTGQVVGTAPYMAPEQARGDNRSVGFAADIYALGAILYEALTGRPPFKGASSSETLQLVIAREPVAPSRLQPKIPRDLETICLKCLAKEPAKRYPSADALADDLERYLADQPIKARRTLPWERAAKRMRRHPLIATVSAIALVAVGSLIAITVRADAEARNRVRLRNERVALKRLEAIDELDRGIALRARGELNEAMLALSTLRTTLQDEPLLAPLRQRAEEAIRDLKAKVEELKSRAADQERFARFARLRDEALFRDTEFFGAERAGPEGRTRQVATAALTVFGTGPRLVPESPPASFTPEQKAEVVAGGDLVLMVLSEAVARPLPGEGPRAQAEAALRLLDAVAHRLARNPAYHLRRASCLERLGDLESARSERGLAADLPPSGAYDHLLLGMERCRLGDWDTARTHFEAAARTRDDLFWAHCLLAIADLNSTPPLAADARAELTICLNRQPAYAWPYLLRGSAHARLGAVRAAVPALRDQAESLFEASEADFRKARELVPGQDQDFHYALSMARGAMRFQRGRFEDAASDFEAAIARFPDRYNAHASLAQAQRRLANLDEAIEQLTWAIALEPAKADLYRGRALARLDRDGSTAAELEVVVRDLEESARREPAGSRASADDHARRGRLLLRLDRDGDRLDSALTAAAAALAIAPDLADAHLVRISVLLQQERHDQVIESCDTALASGVSDPALHLYRGLGRVGRRDLTGAIDDFNRALIPRPDWVEAHAQRGWAYLFTGATELALHDFEAVIRIDPGKPEGYAGRASARARSGLVRDAISDAEESLRRADPSRRLLYLAAQTYALAATRTTPRNRTTSRDSIAYEESAIGLLERALKQTPAGQRSVFWGEVVAKDPSLRPLLHNPKYRLRLSIVRAEVARSQ